MKGFSGFPNRKMGLVKVPEPFFTELLPIIDHLGELKVTAYAFWALWHKAGRVRYLSWREIAESPEWWALFDETEDVARELLRDGLERAAARGTLLEVSVAGAEFEDVFYFMNTQRGRATVEAITKGEWRPDDLHYPAALVPERPAIFTVYEQNFGPLTPLIADMLRDAEETYPEDWIDEAMALAVRNNVRKWSYVEAILERWQTEGKDGAKRQERGGELDHGRYADIIQN